jgi:hypothetical protein
VFIFNLPQALASNHGSLVEALIKRSLFRRPAIGE